METFSLVPVTGMLFSHTWHTWRVETVAGLMLFWLLRI
jgi:hypothetical protein